MRLSIFTTCLKPYQRGDMFEVAINCYRDLADEVVVVNGRPAIMKDIPDPVSNFLEAKSNVRLVCHWWPEEFKWSLIGEQFQRGYEAARGDWVIHADLDFFFHERDMDGIRKAINDNPEAPALSFWKYQFILPDRYNLKSRLVLAVNKKRFGDRISFNSGGDLCQPSLDGIEIKPESVPETKIPIYNYEKMTKTFSQIKNDVSRMARAWERQFGEYKLGGPSEKSALDEWLKMSLGRFNKPQQQIPLSKHPKYVQQTIKTLRPNQWGYNGLGHLEENNYVQGSSSSR